MSSAESDDATLVIASLNGDREAFGQIVSRYQALVASVAYSGTGNLAQSEDLAQETFVAAWKQLKSLQEPGKLRAWLYGIARRVAANALRRQQREPVQRAVPLEVANETPTPEAMPVERAITHEEEAILWRSLEQIPETYREPLILFYREDQSVQRVAESLELSPEAVRQRLSRGRKLLEERVAAFVEGALRQSVPGPSFTLAVLGALPAPVTSIGTASASAAAAKTGAATKTTAWLAVLNAFGGLLVGFLAAYLGYKTDMADAASARQRQLVRQFYGVLAATVLVSVGLLLLVVLVRSLALSHPELYASLAIASALSWVPPIGLLLVRIARAINAQSSAGFSSATDGCGGPAAYEYRSRVALLGWPLVHIRFGGTPAVRRTPVKGWIALGEVALGGLFAAGGIAMAPLAIGGIARNSHLAPGAQKASAVRARLNARTGERDPARTPRPPCCGDGKLEKTIMKVVESNMTQAQEMKSPDTGGRFDRDRSSWLWLLLGFLLLPFTAWQTVIPLAAWLAPVFLLRFVRTPGWKRLKLWLVFAAYAGGHLIAIRGLKWNALYELLVWLVMVPLCRGLIYVLPYVADVRLGSRLTGWARVLVFPAAFTTLDWATSLNPAITTAGSPAYSQIDNLALMQLTSITGMWGVTFLVAWFAATANALWEHHFEWRSVHSQVAVFASVMLAVGLFGEARLNFAAPSSTNTQAATVTLDSAVQAAASKGIDWGTFNRSSDAQRGAVRPQFQATVNQMLARTETALRYGAKLVGWQEAAALVLGGPSRRSRPGVHSGPPARRQSAALAFGGHAHELLALPPQRIGPYRRRRSCRVDL